MTTALAPTDGGSKAFSAEYLARFITASELRNLEADEFLNARDVWEAER